MTAGWSSQGSSPADPPVSGGESVASGMPVTIDCDHCQLRNVGCGDCVVTVLLGAPPPDVALSEEERHALDVLSSAGLVPPLRMVDARDTPSMPDEWEPDEWGRPEEP